MSMVIRNNMEAVRTYNLLNSNYTNAQKHMQKVSTGMKLNSAQDDASAFSISERMRVRIRALDQAYQNVQNGSAMMRTAEGAVSNILETLRTLKEKAIDAANDSNTDEDRRIIQKEFNQLVDQIDDDALTQFNGMYLINNTRNNAFCDTKTIFISHNFATDLELSRTPFSSLKTRLGENLGIQDDDTISVSYIANGQTVHGKVKGTDSFSGAQFEIWNNSSFKPYTSATAPNFSLPTSAVGSNDVTDKFGNRIETESGFIAFVPNNSETEIYKQPVSLNFQVSDAQGNVNKFATAQLQFVQINRGESKTGDRALSFHVGAQANQATKVALTDMRTEALGLRGNTGNIISISTKEDANAAINAIDVVIKRVLDEQTNIAGALSRFDFTATNITTMTTNDQSSESVIRDADMATEMAGFIRYSVLSQSAQAMLAHANQEPMNVLVLLNS